jgi:MarR family transcriptional regulator, lower aerobic nicotinate degradation pathway regulator
MEESSSGTPPRRLTQLPSWLAAEVARQGRRLVAEALAEEGARRPQFAVLTALAEEGGVSQAALGRRVWMDRSDLHALLNELERDGLITRTPDERDRRRKLVELTPAGARTLERLDTRVQAAQEALLEPLSARDRDTLVRLLTRLAAARRR